MIDRGLRPMTLGDIFAEGFDLYKKNLALFLLIAAVIAVPVKIVEAVLAATYVGDLQGMLSSIGKDELFGAGFTAFFGDYLGKFSILAVCYFIAYAKAKSTLAQAGSQRY